MDDKIFDVLIVGAGPAGCATALSLSSSGLRVALIDKAIFPREKICGDGITMDTLAQLEKLSPRLAKNVKNLKYAVNCKGYLISASNGKKRFFKKPENYQNYIVEREHFDNELIKECKLYHNIRVLENTKTKSYSISENKVELNTSNGNFTGKIIVGADGANSIIAKTINPNRSKETNFGIGVRAYFDNVKDDGNKDLIEIHYLKDLLPGYFWIFHLSNNKTNVGIGIDQKFSKKKNLNLSKIFLELIENSPILKGRFESAKMIGQIKAHRLPYFNNYKKIYGERILLVGDAANVVNPLTGEGVANAIRTGRLAATQINNCFSENNFSTDFNKSYYKTVKAALFPGLKKYAILTKLVKSPFLTNMIIKSDFICNTLSKQIIKLVD